MINLLIHWVNLYTAIYSIYKIIFVSLFTLMYPNSNVITNFLHLDIKVIHMNEIEKLSQEHISVNNAGNF